MDGEMRIFLYSAGRIREGRKTTHRHKTWAINVYNENRKQTWPSALNDVLSGRCRQVRTLGFGVWEEVSGTVPAGEATCRVRASREREREGQTENGAKGNCYVKSGVSQHTSLTDLCVPSPQSILFSHTLFLNIFLLLYKLPCTRQLILL